MISTFQNRHPDLAAHQANSELGDVRVVAISTAIDLTGDYVLTVWWEPKEQMFSDTLATMATMDAMRGM